MINFPKIFKDDMPDQIKQKLPLLPLRDIVVFPYMVAPLFVGRAKSINALADAMNKNKNIFLASQKKVNIDNPQEKDINSIGVFGKVLQLLKLPDNTVKILVKGKSRGCIKRFIQHNGFFSVDVEPVVEPEIQIAEGIALSRAVIESFEKYADLSKNISRELVGNISAISNPSQLADTIAAHFSFKIEDKQHLLETFSIGKRLSMLLSLIKIEIDIFKMDKRIKSRVKKQVEKTQ
ncbi:MAG: LON peptidase substrate-binding domain-containing protein, partial [Desulfobacterales bacterium]|nr:LON peptidase substrate-binding domain-containing protein [Desulfobacterales bacterium]